MAGRYELVGRGSDLAIRVEGDDVADCLAAAVEGFAAALAVVEGQRGSARRVPVSVAGDTPEDLLVGLLDEAIALLDIAGDLAVGLRDPRVDERGLKAVVEVLPLEGLDVHGAAPKAATWHESRLEPAGDGWAGEVMLDL